MWNLIATCWRSVALAVLASLTCSPASARMSEGAEVYARHCVVCHGVNGDGQGLSRIALVLPPRDFTTEDARRALTREYMIVIVRDGRPNTPMHGRKTRLKQSQIESVVDFVRAAFMQPEPGTSLARGHDLYQAMCASCHSDRGQASQAVRGQPFSPLSATARATPPTQAQVLAAIARPGHGVPAGFAATLPEPDIDALAKYIASAFIDPYRPQRAGTKRD
jgi:mono/diheme cytochrome c family protein